MPTDGEMINGIAAPGRYDAKTTSEADALRLVRLALPGAIELPKVVSGQPYPSPPPSVKCWYQVHPPDAPPGSNDPNLPHVKYVDWTKGKKGRGGSWGHLYFPKVVGV